MSASASAAGSAPARTPPADEARGTPAVPAALLAALVLAGLALRGIEAALKSLWLDEFHTLHAALAPDLAGLVERIRIDFHPPLYFAWVHGLLEVVPLERAQLLRWLSIAGGMASLVPLLALARRMALSPLARAVAVAVFATAPYQLMFGTELRAYPFLELFSVCLAWAAFTDRARARTRFAVFALATALGLYHHYFAALAVVAVGAVRLFVRAPGLLSWRALVAAGALGVLAFLPWVAIDESWIFEDPGALVRTDMVTPNNAAPDGKSVAEGTFFDQDLLKVAVVPLRTVVPRMGSLGGGAAWGARAGALVFFGTVAALLWRLLRAPRRAQPARGEPAIVWGVLATSATAYALTILVCMWIWDRVPEQYFMIAAWGWPLLAGLLVDRLPDGRARRRAALALVLSCLVMGTSHALGASREDTRAGVRSALREGGPEALYTCVLWQPPWYSDRLPLQVYAPLAASCEPKEVPRATDSGGARRVVVTTRFPTWGKDPARWSTIRAGRELVKTVQVDHVTWVHVLDPTPAKGRGPQ